ncbi:MAG: hypothetical protein ACE5GJ_00625 [Gemmatimonadota bacterium]
MNAWIIQAIVGAGVWAVANAVYADMKLNGRHGMRRFFAFLLGMPTTVALCLVLPEGRPRVVQPPADDEAALLEEIRRARALGRGGREKGTDGTEGMDPGA